MKNPQNKYKITEENKPTTQMNCIAFDKVVISFCFRTIFSIFSYFFCCCCNSLIETIISLSHTYSSHHTHLLLLNLMCSLRHPLLSLKLFGMLFYHSLNCAIAILLNFFGGGDSKIVCQCLFNPRMFRLVCCQHPKQMVIE